LPLNSSPFKPDEGLIPSFVEDLPREPKFEFTSVCFQRRTNLRPTLPAGVPPEQETV
jgi:hypothetical protein